MIKVFLTAGFVKQYKKLPPKLRKKFLERVALFKENPCHRLLRVHGLKGDKEPLISMNVTGDYRALFVWETEERVRFHQIGTHSELY